MRNITAREIALLEGLAREKGDEELAKDYAYEYKQLQDEMNKD